MSANSLPLSRFKVIDLCRARAGPTCVKQLADWGAETIKVEAPPSMAESDVAGNRHGFDFNNLHRNKRSLTLNMKEEEGKEVFFRLVKDADVVVENFRPGVKHRLGIGYEACAKVNPRIIYGSLSGFGQEGPYAKRPGLDQIAQGLGGLMSVTGEPGRGPMRVGIPVADLTGGMFLAQGILVALLEREVSGKGQWVHTSLLEAMIQMMDFQAARYLKDKDVPKQQGNNHPTGVPTGVFETSDGAINIQAGTQHLFKRLCEGLGVPELYEKAGYEDADSRRKNRDRLNAEINEQTKKKAKADWIEIMEKIGVPCGPIYKMDETWNDPQVKTLHMDPLTKHQKLGDVRVVGQAVKLTRTPQPDIMRLPTPELGEHTDAILRDLGYDDSTIKALHEKGVV
ncbi:MAG: CaiB/BaiF CoA-transferase family protein [Acetobacterales bacterium]